MNQEIAEALLNEQGHDEVDFFEAVTKENICGQSRWSTRYDRVFKDTRDETFWRLAWSRGSTEYQDNGIEGIEFEQVKPKEVTVIQYVRVES